MFIEILSHEGVWMREDSTQEDGNWEHRESYRLNFGGSWEHREGYRLNLNFVKTVEFKKCEMFENDGKLYSNDNYKEKRAITVNIISFGITSGNDLKWGCEYISLCFSKEGEGEFQRIRRIIDENTFK
ncbi:MAG: hypothetical protein DRR19_32185 [Candidatus Parabeggiatoa sp. nov. 1]|nr:MAG: hypothetical protein DRR19_32185 [Gammaproteobacteria bacterium]